MNGNTLEPKFSVISDRLARISGRVGLPTLSRNIMVPSLSDENSDETLILYHKLYSLRETNESELAKAISYGLKIRALINANQVRNSEELSS